MRGIRLCCTPYYPLFLMFFLPSVATLDAFRLPPVPRPLGLLVFLASLGVLLTLKYQVFRRNLKGPTPRPVRLFALSNVLSTVYGMLLGSVMLSPLFLVLTLPILFVILRPVAALLAARIDRPFLPAGLVLALLAVLTAAGTLFFFALMQANVWNWNDPGALVTYWVAKVCFFTLGAGILLFFSAWIELAAMKRIARTSDDPWPAWGDAVLRANAAVFILFLFFAAAVTLPQRFGAPHGLLAYPDRFFLEMRLR